MKTVGIVCEYNPFHRGHSYQMEEAKNRTGAEAVVCAMSGNYTQRGEPACTDKWTRAQMALAGGADLVAEIPTLYAMNGAARFAEAGMKLLHAMRADAVSFGCETEDSAFLRSAAEVIAREPKEFADALKKGLEEGRSFANSRENALAEALGGSERVPQGILKEPGVILGIEYMAAADRMDWHPEFVPALRKGSGHDGECADANRPEFLSAMAIRRILRRGDVPAGLPAGSLAVLAEAKEAGRLLPDPSFWNALLWAKLSEGEGALGDIPELADGLENRVLHLAKQAESLEELAELASSRRITYARARRGLMNLCLGVTGSLREKCGYEEGPLYLRILGRSVRGEEVLKRIAAGGVLPIVASPASDVPALPEKARNAFGAEERFTGLYAASLKFRSAKTAEERRAEEPCRAADILPQKSLPLCGTEYREKMIKNERY